MLEISVCVGSSCFLRGAPDVIKRMQELVGDHGISRTVIIKGSFCMEHCTKGVTVRIGENMFTGVKPEEVDDLFRNEVLAKVGG